MRKLKVNSKLITIIFLVVLLISFIAQFNFVVGDNVWLNTDYSFRKTHVINALNGSDVGYQVNFTAHWGFGVDSSYDVYLENNSQVDFDDIRLYASNGSLLSAWNQSQVNGDQIKVWVKVSANLTLVSEIISIYYGDVNAVSYWNQTSTFIDVISGVVGVWQMDEGLGATVYDSSGNNNDGTIMGATWVVGKYGNGLNFTGVYTEKISLVSNLNFAPNDASFSCWFNIVGWTDGHSGMIATKAGSTLTYISYIFSSTEIAVATDVIGTVKYFVVPTINLGNWYQLMITRHLNITRVYLNGVESTTGGQTQTDITTLNVFGSYSVYDAYSLKGRLDEFRFYNHGLMSTEVLNIYSNFGDSTLEVGKVLVRKFVSTEVSQGIWGNQEYLVPQPTSIPTAEPTPSPTVSWYESPLNVILLVIFLVIIIFFVLLILSCVNW